MTRLLNTPIIGRKAAPVASSCSDMLAGLSKNEILRMPPAFWANAPSAVASAITIAATVAAARSFQIMNFLPDDAAGYHVGREPGYWKIRRRVHTPSSAQRSSQRSSKREPL